MRDSGTKGKRAGAAQRGGSGRSTDAQSGDVEKLIRLGKAVGNEEIQKRLGQGAATREELLAFMQQRLGAVREAQNREIAISDGRSQRDWWWDVGWSKTEKPEPTRYNETARLYELAAQQLCRGDLSRGAQLMERAMTEEKRAFESVTSLVNVKDLEQDQAPAALAEVVPGQATGSCALPDGIAELAREIQGVTKEVDDPPAKKVKKPWWTEEEEEEEEENDESGGS